MGYRILVDENLDPRTAVHLRSRGHDAVHVEATLGTADPPIARFARRNDRALLTNAADFLGPPLRAGIRICYCPDGSMRGHPIARLVDELAASIPDLPGVTWLTESRRL